jgi:hypothetical protein
MRMKLYHFRFKEPLTEEQEKCLYAGFSAFFYDVQDGLDKGIKQANNKLYRSLSNLTRGVTGLDGAQMALDRLKIIRDNLEAHISWDRSEPAYYWFRLNVQFINTAVPTMGDKLDHKIQELFKKKVRPKMGLKEEDVEIVMETF